MRSAAFWMMVAAVLILAYIWQEHKFFMAKPQPWPTENGEILANRIQAIETEAGRQFRVELVYRYRQEDSVREGVRIRPSDAIYASLEQAERAAKAFPVGKEVKVYVNPHEKSEPASVLIWEFPDIWSPVVFVIIILAATSLALYLTAEYRKYRK